MKKNNLLTQFINTPNDLTGINRYGYRAYLAAMLSLGGVKTDYGSSLSTECLEVLETFSTFLPTLQQIEKTGLNLQQISLPLISAGLRSFNRVTTNTPFALGAEEIQALIDHNNKITNDIIVGFINRVNHLNNNLSLDDLELMYYHSVINKNTKYSYKYLVHLFTLMFSLSTQSNANITSLTKRWSAFCLEYPSIGDESQPNLSVIGDLFNHLEKKISLGLKMDTLVDDLKALTSPLNSIVITPLLDQVSFSRMTVFKRIVDALLQYPTIPWRYLFKKYPILQTECLTIANFWLLVEKSPYAGLNFPGIGRQVPNLACLCYYIHLILGGNKTLIHYNGVGSERNEIIPVPMRTAFKSLITKISQKTFEVDLPEEFNPDEFQSPTGLLQILSGLEKEVDEVDGDASVFTKEDFWKDDVDPDPGNPRK